MSQWRKEAKAASEAKLNRMGLNKKTEKSPTFDGVHAWDGLPGLDSGDSGKKPIGKQRFKRGGKVKHMAAEGGKANKHLGKAPRAKKREDGGRLPGQGEAAQYAQARRKAYDSYKNTKEAGEFADKTAANNSDPALRQLARESVAKQAAKSAVADQGFGRAMKETGYGYAKGGFAGANPAARKAMAAKIAYKKKGPTGFGNISYGLPKAKGGKVHDDVAQDRALIRKEVKPSALKSRLRRDDGGKTPYNGPTHTFDLEFDGGVGPGSKQSFSGNDFNESVNRWMKLAKKAGWENTGVKHTGTSYPGSSAGLMNKGGRTKKADGGSAERWLKTPKGSHEGMEGLGSLEYREHTARAKPFKSREERGPYRTPQHFRDLEGSIARLSEKTARMNPNSKSAKEGPKYGGTKGVQRKHREEDENASLTSSGLKHGGRAHKAAGGGSFWGSKDFQNAFREARKSYLAGEGPKTFEYNGKSYSTDLMKIPTPPERPAPRREKIIDVQFGASSMPKTDQMGNPNPGMRKGGAAHKARGGSLSKDEAMAKKLNISSKRNIGKDEELSQLRRWKGLQKALTKQTRSKMFPKGMYHPSEYGDEGEPEATPERMRSIENSAFRKSVDEANKRIKSPDFAGWAEQMKEEKGYNAKGGRIQRATGGRTRRKSSKTNINIIIPNQGNQQGPQGGMQQAIPPELLAAMMGGGGAPGMPPAGPAPAIPPMAPPPGMPGMAPAGAGPGLGAMGAMMPGGPGMTPPMPPMRKHGGRIAKQGGGALGAAGFDGGQQNMGGRPSGGNGAPITMMNPGGQTLPQAAMMHAQGQPFQPGGKFNPVMPTPIQPTSPQETLAGIANQMGGAPQAGMMNPGGQMLPQQAMANAQGMPFQPGGAFNPMMYTMGQPMARKDGGRTMPKYRMKDVGSGSGLGRLEKAKFPPANGTAPVGKAYGGVAGKTGPLGSSGPEDMIFGTQGNKGASNEANTSMVARAEGSYAAKKGEKSSGNPYPKGHEFHTAWKTGHTEQSKKKGK